MTKLDEMWAALAAYQPQADAAGHGESWAKMCQEKTAYAAADAADAAYAVDAAAYAADTTYAAATEHWAQRAIDRISKVLKVAAPVVLAEQGEPVELREALASALTSTYVCMRVWEAWHVGTMTENDFFPASECDELLDELVHAVATTPPQPAQQEPTALTAEQVNALLKANGYGDASALERVAFICGLRHGELAHNIKEHT